MTNENNTQIFDLIKEIDTCKDVLTGFNQILLLENETQNETLHFIFNQQSKTLGEISKKMLSILSK
jgi:hypothetical protein